MTAIEVKYNQVVASGHKIGNPKNTESVCADGRGYYRHFEGGSIFWNGQPSAPAFLVYGLILAKWSALGWERSRLGYPTTDETAAGSGNGSRYNNFQNGIIMWKGNSPEAFAIYGTIYQKWAEQGYDVGGFGLPTSDDTMCADGKGHYGHFDGGSIFWNGQPGTPPYLIYGLIRAKWFALGWERGSLGYPTSDETDAGSGKGSRYNRCQNGIVMWKGGTSEAFAISGAIYQKWAEEGYDIGSLGLPISDQTLCTDGKGYYSHFDGGTILWNGQSGTLPYLMGRREFDVKFYLASYGDLQTAFGTTDRAALDHWVNYGLNEGRRGSREFDVQFYLTT